MNSKRMHIGKSSVLMWLVLGGFLIFHNLPVSAEVLSAEELYAEYQNSVMQVRIIEIKSNSQNSMGSGFFVADGSLIATNYHVISSAVMESEDFKVETEVQGETHTLQLLQIDVVNDLAILRSPTLGTPLTISTTEPAKGSRLFSLGNPHDIGKSVVEGNYNGLVSDTFFDQIHFSGAINSGMSGGPTLNANGEVVGVNVASAGNQVGFLVPAKHLKILVDRSVEKNDEEIDFISDMTEQIGEATRYMVESMLDQEWKSDSLGNAKILGQVHPAVECWGNSHKNEDTGFRSITKGCANRNGFYLDRRFNTGVIEYEFAFYEAENWPSSSFYNTLTARTSRAGPGNQANKKNVENYQCQSKLVNSDANNIERKISYCVRSYKKLKGLFDVLYVSASVDKKNSGVSGHYTLSGVTKETAQRFLREFVKQVAWE